MPKYALISFQKRSKGWKVDFALPAWELPSKDGEEEAELQKNLNKARNDLWGAINSYVSMATLLACAIKAAQAVGMSAAVTYVTKPAAVLFPLLEIGESDHSCLAGVSF